MDFIILDADSLVDFLKFFVFLIIVIISAIFRFISKEAKQKTPPRPQTATQPGRTLSTIHASSAARLANLKEDDARGLSGEMTNEVARTSLEEYYAKEAQAQALARAREEAEAKERFQASSPASTAGLLSASAKTATTQSESFFAPEETNLAAGEENRPLDFQTDSITEAYEKESGDVPVWERINALPFFKRAMVLMEIFKKPVGLRPYPFEDE